MHVLPRRRQKAVGKRRKGAATVEAAIMLPVLMLILLGLIQFAWMGLVHHTMLRASEHGARSWAIQGYTQAESEQRARDALSAVFGDFANDFQITSTGSGNDRSVQVSIPASTNWVSFGDVFSLLAGRPDMFSSATLRDEGSY